MAEVKWIKIVTDIFDDEKMLLIESLPKADSILVIWFKLLCLAGKQNNNGIFVLNDKIPYTEKMLASIFRRKETTIKLALKTFENFGMIEIIDNVITIPNWEKHQALDKLELTKEQTRKRVAKHREKQKILIEKNKNNNKCNVTCNVTETQKVTLQKRNVTLTDKEEDKDKEIDNRVKEKNKKETEFDQLINQNFSNEELKKTIYDFIKMRITIKKPLTTKGLELMIKKLNSLSNNKNEQIEILNNSIMNNWQGIFPLKKHEEKGNINDFQRLWEEAKAKDEQTGNSTSNNTFGW